MEKVNNLIGKSVIEYTEHEKGEFISPILFCSKSDGKSRLILNLKTFNEFLEYNHFKMGTIHSVADFIQSHCYTTSIDLTDIYYSVKKSQEYRKLCKTFSRNFFFEICCATKWIAFRSSKVHKAH